MNRFWIKWSVGAALTLLIFLAAARWAYFPGDVPVARFLQSVAGANLDWARSLTNTAQAPWNYVLLAIAAVLSWWLAGWRGGVAAILSFFGMLLAGPYLQNLVERPRPTNTLIDVAGSSSGFSFPSIFALTYDATLGFVALQAWTRGGNRFQGHHHRALLRVVIDWRGGARGARRALAKRCAGRIFAEPALGGIAGRIVAAGAE
jgi:hypothetical protein